MPKRLKAAKLKATKGKRMIKNVEQLARMIKESKKIVAFTGAGISVPSGIPDFRSADGLYNESGYNYPPEQIISHSFFVAHTEMFFDFYKSKMVYPDAKPNDAHRFFALLEEKGKDVTVVTQNIDGLHQAAGSKKVVELHGSVRRNYCMKCGKFFDDKFVTGQPGVPKCDCGGTVKPDVVLYEENLNEDDINSAVKALSGADMVIVVGTSLVVYPAASFVRYYRGDKLVLINKSPTSFDSFANLCFNCDVIDVVHELSGINK